MKNNVELLKELENPVLELSDRVCSLYSRKRQELVEALGKDLESCVNGLDSDNVPYLMQKFLDSYWYYHHQLDGLGQYLDLFVDDDEFLEVMQDTHDRAYKCMSYWAKRFGEKVESINI